jgi:beta-phosphoglucomutase-like phosphatase (HAD superfamily)
MNSLRDLVIFDCDGVLVDSEVIAYRIFAECLNEAGIMLSIDEAMAFGVGKSATILAAAVEKEFGRSLPVKFTETFRARVMAAFTQELKAVEGIIELLAALKLKRCVASNSHIDWVRHALMTAGLSPHLEPHIYTAAMVERRQTRPGPISLRCRAARCSTRAVSGDRGQLERRRCGVGGWYARRWICRR